jgi:hypothetical protein
MVTGCGSGNYQDRHLLVVAICLLMGTKSGLRRILFRSAWKHAGTECMAKPLALTQQVPQHATAKKRDPQHAADRLGLVGR